MSADLPGRVTAQYILLVRCFFLILGCIAVWWGVTGFSVFWQESSIGRIANRIIAGEPFKVTVLTQQLPAVESAERPDYCYPSALQSAAIIQLRLFEIAASGNTREHVDANLKGLTSIIRKSLSCSPADPFLWLVLYRLESSQSGVRPEYFRYLKMSYALGPNEGWILIKRNPVAFADFRRLPADLAFDAINEFMALLNSQFFQQAVDIFSGPAWSARDAILPHLATLPLRTREAFARAVYNRGLDVTIPGVEPPESKPAWR